MYFLRKKKSHCLNLIKYTYIHTNIGIVYMVRFYRLHFSSPKGVYIESTQSCFILAKRPFFTVTFSSSTEQRMIYPIKHLSNEIETAICYFFG